jgi:hypothetical protein
MINFDISWIKLNARFPPGEFVRAKGLFPLSASLITSTKAMLTKEKPLRANKFTK